MKIIKYFWLVLLAAVLAAGCASIKPAGDEDILEIIGFINNGDSAELAALSAESFLLDAEILTGPALTSGLWKGFADAGFRINNPVITESRPVQASDSAVFGGSMETEVFFSRHIPPQSTFFRIAADSSDYVIVLGPSEKGPNMIFAFGGPF